MNILKLGVVAILGVSILPLPGICGENLTLNFSGAMTYTGPADASSVGEQIGPSWGGSGANRYMCRNNRFARAVVAPVGSATSLTVQIDGVTYQVFDSGTPGVGWVLGVKDTYANNFSALLNRDNQWFPASGTGSGPTQNIGGNAHITFVKTTNHLQTGVSIIPTQNVAQVRCYGSGGNLLDSAYIRINALPLTVTATGCEMQSSTAPVVNMGDVSTSSLPNIGSVSDGKSVTLSLRCDTGISVAATVSDQTNKGNITNTISLSAGSTAKGVGIQAFYNGSNTPVNLGPDNSSKGNTNQFSITRTSLQGQVVNVPLTFKYVRTGAIEAGSANGLVGVTFSYQ